MGIYDTSFFRRLPWQLLRYGTGSLELPPSLMLNTEATFDFSLSVFRGSNVPQFFLLPRLTFSLPWRPDLPTQLRSETIPIMAKTKTLVPQVCSIIKVYCLAKEEFQLLLLKLFIDFPRRENRLSVLCLKIYNKEERKCHHDIFLGHVLGLSVNMVCTLLSQSLLSNVSFQMV